MVKSLHDKNDTLYSVWHELDPAPRFFSNVRLSYEHGQQLQKEYGWIGCRWSGRKLAEGASAIQDWINEELNNANTFKTRLQADAARTGDNPTGPVGP